jgi:DNA polymerase III subunit delta'
MDGARTRGHPAALAAVGARIGAGSAGAVLLVGPSGIGKTTLATDLAAGLLCTAADVSSRPCGECRACRLAFTRGHPDVHYLGPEGPGRQVVIGGPGKPRGIRDLIAELALLPVEGAARVAIIESAHRMNEDAQAALLKTLEEPPSATTIVLCADAEEPLLPTILSRCVRIRLGPVGVRDIEAIVAEHGAADPPVAARAARIAGGRPGVALRWILAPDALRDRDMIGRSLLDLAGASPADRLAGIRSLASQAATIAAIASEGGSLAGPGGTAASGASAATQPARTRGSRKPKAPDEEAQAETPDNGDSGVDEAVEPTRTPATERRRAADALVAVWTDVTRDLVLSQLGLDGSVRDIGTLDDTRALAGRLTDGDLHAFLERLGQAAVLIAGNVSPELVLDDLALAWPGPARRAA